MLTTSLAVDFNSDPIEYEFFDTLDFQGKLFFLGWDRNGTIHNTHLRVHDPATGEITSVAQVSDHVWFTTFPVPGEMTALGDQFFFRGHAEGGSQLWRYDPAANDGAGGAEIIEDFDGPFYDSFPTFLTVMDGKLYFQATSILRGTELWVLDPEAIGTPDQTKLVADLVPWTGSSSPSHLTVLDGKLYFQANDGQSGVELWVYDPQANDGEGSVTLVTDIVSGSGSSAPQEMVAYNDMLYFQATVPGQGAELWRYDPAANGGAGETTLVADIYDGSESSSPSELTVVGDQLYFRATDQDHGTEVFVYNPLDGVSVAADIGSGSSNSDPEFLTELDGLLYFQIRRATSGTEFRTIDPSTGQMDRIYVPRSTGGEESNLGIFDGKLVFRAHDAPAYRSEIFFYNPQDESFSKLYDPVRTDESSIRDLVEIDGILYVSATTDAEGKELWQYDPQANNGQGAASIAAHIPGRPGGYWPFELTVFDDAVYFRGSTSGVSEMWLFRYDPEINGPTSDAELVFQMPVKISSPYQFTPGDDRLYFVIDDRTHGKEIWELVPQANGEPPQSRMVADLAEGLDSLNPELLFVDAGKLYFWAGIYGRQLWQYDPAANDGQGEAAIVEALSEYNTQGLTVLNDRFYFQHDSQLWQYDPTSPSESNAPRSLGVLNDGIYSEQFVVLGEKAYFVSTMGNLWEFNPDAADGEAELTMSVGGAAIDSEGFTGSNLAASYGRLFFPYSPGAGIGSELWEFYPEHTGGDGTLRQVSDIGTEFDAMPTELITVDNDVYFIAFHQDIGRELFVHSFNPEPVANDDSYHVAEDTELIVAETSLLDNDFDYNSEDFWASVDVGPAHGQLTIHPDGTFHYAPAPDFSGTDQFTYLLTDGEGATSTGQVTITVESRPDPATISGDLTYTTHEDESLPLMANLVVNDVDPGEDIFQPITNQQGTYGIFSIAPDGQWTYRFHSDPQHTIPAGSTVTDSFQVTSHDATATETVTIFIDGLNDIPFLGGTTTGVTSEESTDDVSGTLTINDVDQGQSFFIPRTGVQGTYGTFSVTALGNWTFQLDNAAVQHVGQGESVHDVFTVTSLDETKTIDVQVTINGENDAPVNEILPITSFRVEEQLIWVESIPSDIDQNNTHFTHEYRIIRLSDEQVVDSRSLGNLTGFPFIAPAAGNYRIEITTADMRGEETTTQREFTVGTQSTVELSFSRDALAIPGSTSVAPESDVRFHEWEDVVGHLWFTLEEGLPTHAFDVQFEITSNNAWLGMPELIDHLGAEIQWTTFGNAVTGTLADVDLTGYQIGDRVLLATLRLPQELENEAGLSMAGQGQYPQAELQSEISLFDARADGRHPFALHTENNAEFVPVIYDANDDGRIGIADFAQFISTYGQTPDQDSPDAYRFDYNGDGRVGVSDFALFIRHYGARKSDDRPIEMPLFENETPEPPAVAPLVLETEPPMPILDRPTESEQRLVLPYPQFLEFGGSVLPLSQERASETELPDLEFIGFCGTPNVERGDFDARLIDAIFNSDENDPSHESSQWDDEHLELLTPEELEDLVR